MNSNDTTAGSEPRSGLQAEDRRDLSAAQQRAATWGLNDPNSLPGPLLISAGAGTGKTRVVAHRVAHGVRVGIDPDRILLLTFTRRAAEEMTRRVRGLVRSVRPDTSAHEPDLTIEWSGTFHAIANRLLRLHALAVGLDPYFTVLDEGDAQDLMDLTRSALRLDETTRMFPRKDTALAIYSSTVNRSLPLEEVLTRWFPQHLQFLAELRALFRAYVEAKQASHTLDFDDLLLYWKLALEHPAVAGPVRDRFDLIFVDEFQDTNPLQGAIVRLLKPDGRGVTVVGDEAQSIYAFRGTTIQNMLDFPHQYDPPAEVLTLQENYRSVQPVLDVANAVLAGTTEGYRKTLTAVREGGVLPHLVQAETVTHEASYVVEQILANREAGWALADQAVLVRAGHDAYHLEAELLRYRIPYIKRGGKKLLEAAHIRDVLSILRWAENPRDEVAAFRTLQLLPKIGPRRAREAFATFRKYSDLSLLSLYPAPVPAREPLAALAALLYDLARPNRPWPGQVAAVRAWYDPLLEAHYDDADGRRRDLEDLEQVAASASSRSQFLTDLALDPIERVARVRPADDDEDCLTLSTIHSAKGLEWRAVYVLRVIDGVLPSSRAETSEDIEEERRLLYVAVTRARDELHLVYPLRLAQVGPGPLDGGEIRQLSRFLQSAVLGHMECEHDPSGGDAQEERPAASAPTVNLGALAQQFWE